jgi:SNF2 family DNA or RNA helicase
MDSQEKIKKGLLVFDKYVEKCGLDSKPYQRDGVAWCLNNELRADPVCDVRGGFIADEMGLGKTILMIGVVLSNLQPRTLIVMPPVLIQQWFNQIYKTTGHRAFVYHGATKKMATSELLKNSRIVLTSYSAISQKSLLHGVEWSRVIFDEAHHLRNRNTERYNGARALKTDIHWLVSGTPVQNKKDDFYSLCAVLNLPVSFYTEPDNLRLLGKSFILKRTKKQVGIEIPDVIPMNTVVDWTNDSEMRLSEEIHSALTFSNVSGKRNGSLVTSISGQGKLAAVMRARQSCIMPELLRPCLDSLPAADYGRYSEAMKHSSKLDFVVETILKNKGNGNGKLIFCHYRTEIDELASRLNDGGIERVATFDGRTATGKRNQLLTGNNEALILQIQTGCEGLNLQENYSEIYFVSPHWNPAIEDQAVARCHRIGQKKQVQVYRFEMSRFVKEEGQELETKTIDAYVTAVQEQKREIANELV